jgi:hypothetical protein
MPTYTGRISSATVNGGGMSFTVSWANPNPPPPELSRMFSESPAWAEKIVLPNIGKNIVVTTFGDPETMQTVTVSA